MESDDTAGAQRATRPARTWAEVRAEGDRIGGSTPKRQAAARQATEDHMRAWARPPASGTAEFGDQHSPLG